MNLDILWTFEIDGVFEVDWIKNIFSDFTIVDHIDSELKFSDYFERTLIVIQDMRDPRFVSYINGFEEKGYQFLILHISDEALNHNVSFYENYKERIVRMIYCQKYTDQFGVLTIPVGYKKGLKKLDLSKKYLVNFVGQIKSDRSQMLSIYQGIEPKYIKLTYQWDDPNGLSTLEYSKVLSESIYTLCPAGWASVDSFRINEAMECGSIPVSVEYNGVNYFEKLYGPNPFLIGKDWNDTIRLINTTDPIKKQKEIDIWWSDFKQTLRQKLKNMLN